MDKNIKVRKIKTVKINQPLNAKEICGNAFCLAAGKCSWWNHSQDAFFVTRKPNTPPGFKGDL